MRFKLLRTMLMVSFAKGSVRPLQSAFARLLAGYVIAIVFGRLLARPINRADLPLGLPLQIIVVCMMGVGFIVGGLIMLTMTAAKTADTRSEGFIRVTYVLPLGKKLRWWLARAPAFIVLSMVGCFGSLLVRATVVATGHNSWLPDAGWLLGLYSFYGVLLLPFLSNVGIKVATFAAYIVITLKIFDWWLQNPDHNMSTYIPYFVVCLLLTPFIGYWLSFRNSPAGITIEQQSIHRQLIPVWLPASWWFVVKLLRHGRTRSSLLIAMLLACLTSVGIYAKSSRAVDPHAVLIISSVLAATFACDVRGILMRYKPPESTMLYGLRGLMRTEVWSTLLGCLLIGLPLLIVLKSSNVDPIVSSFVFTAYFVAVHVFAGLVGLCIGSLLVPASAETGNQFFAGILASAILLVFPKLTKITDLSFTAQLPYWLTGAILAWGIINIVERSRRKHYGFA